MSPQLEAKQAPAVLNKSEMANYESKGRGSSIHNSEVDKIDEINKNR
jgi:hypothetical protein